MAVSIKFPFPGKLYDSTATPSKSSALEKWWQKKGLRAMLETIANAKLPSTEQIFNADFVSKKYGLAGFQFGNWLTQEDRYNYLFLCAAGLYHLSHTVLKVPPSKIGLNKLSICFGSRGIRKSLAHFNSSLSLIHINRWYRAAGSRKKDEYLDTFKASPHYGSFAHEFGHWIDCLNGKFTSGGRLVCMGVRKSVIEGPTNTAAYHQERIFETLFFQDNGEPTAWCKAFMDIKATEYWYRRTEIFARYFEALCSMLLEKNKIASDFICHPDWYGGKAYAPQDLLVKTLPHFTRYIAAWQKEAKVFTK